MIKVFALVLVFGDGFHGGREEAAYFYDKPKCEQAAVKLVDKYNLERHPTSFYCTQQMMDKKYAKYVSK